MVGNGDKLGGTVSSCVWRVLTKLIFFAISFDMSLEVFDSRLREEGERAVREERMPRRCKTTKNNGAAPEAEADEEEEDEEDQSKGKGSPAKCTPPKKVAHKAKPTADADEDDFVNPNLGAVSPPLSAAKSAKKGKKKEVKDECADGNASLKTTQSATKGKKGASSPVKVPHKAKPIAEQQQSDADDDDFLNPNLGAVSPSSSAVKSATTYNEATAKKTPSKAAAAKRPRATCITPSKSALSKSKVSAGHNDSLHSKPAEDMGMEDKRCQVCASTNCEDKMLLCDKCDNGYHIDCLKPPLKKIPDGDWACKACKRAEKDERTPSNASAKKTPHPTASAKRSAKSQEEPANEDDDFQEGSLNKGKRKSIDSVRIFHSTLQTSNFSFILLVLNNSSSKHA